MNKFRLIIWPALELDKLEPKDFLEFEFESAE